MQLIVNCIFITGGGGHANNKYVATILKFDPTSLSWSLVGEMAQDRAYHGASIVR